MRNTLVSGAITRIAGISLLLVMNERTAWSSQIDKGERERIKQVIEQSLTNERQSKTEKTEEEIRQLTSESVPVLIDFALNEALSQEFRRQAFLFLKAIPDERILAPLTRHYISCHTNPVKPCDFPQEIWETFASYYRKTKDERAISLFVEQLTSESWPLRSKIVAVTVLIRCKDTRTDSILKELVINNRTYPEPYHKALAAAAIAENGDESVLPYLIEFANFMLDDSVEKGGGRLSAALEGLRGLRLLAKKNDVANQALQQLAQKFITDTISFYVYRDQYFNGDDIIPALAGVGREENIRLIERLLAVSDREVLVRQMISVLGETGDDKTIRFLEKFGRYPEETKQAIAQIKERRTVPK